MGKFGPLVEFLRVSELSAAVITANMEYTSEGQAEIIRLKGQGCGVFVVQGGNWTSAMNVIRGLLALGIQAGREGWRKERLEELVGKSIEAAYSRGFGKEAMKRYEKHMSQRRETDERLQKEAETAKPRKRDEQEENSSDNPLGLAASVGSDGGFGAGQGTGQSKFQNPVAKKGRTNKSYTPAEEQRLKTLREAGSSWSEIAKTFPLRTEEAVRRHWHKVRPRESPPGQSTNVDFFPEAIDSYGGLARLAAGPQLHPGAALTTAPNKLSTVGAPPAWPFTFLAQHSPGAAQTMLPDPANNTQISPLWQTGFPPQPTAYPNNNTQTSPQGQTGFWPQLTAYNAFTPPANPYGGMPIAGSNAYSSMQFPAGLSYGPFGTEGQTHPTTSPADMGPGWENAASHTASDPYGSMPASARVPYGPSDPYRSMPTLAALPYGPSNPYNTMQPSAGFSYGSSIPLGRAVPAGDNLNIVSRRPAAQQHARPGYDFSKYDISGYDLSGYDLSGHDFSGHDFSGHGSKQ